MAVLNRDDFLSAIKMRIGDGTTDDDIRFLEDMTETYDSLKPKSEKDWEAEYRTLDEQWRRRYIDRFYGIEDENEKEVIMPEDVTPEGRDTVEADASDITIEELLERDIVK